ncbi:MAG: peptide deformylase [Eubacterium ramulus]
MNPGIVAASEEQSLGKEGCLSVPDVVGEVWRSNEIVVRYIPELTSIKRMLSREKTDSTFKFEVKVEYRNTWEPVCDTIRGFTAVIFQHEIDHLNGILFTDKMIKE